MNIFLCLVWIILGIAGTSQAALAQSTRAEQRLSEELAATVTAGRAVQLSDSEQAFLGIFLESQAKSPRGGMILLHDINNHADWPDVISPIRQAMAKHGWHTLSVQLPTILENQSTSRDTAQWEALEKEIHRRIGAAIEYCQRKRIFNLVLLGHQFGAVMASHYAAKQSGENAFSALVAVNLYSPANRLGIDTKAQIELFSDIKIAFLDIVPSQSPDFALAQAENRKLTMSKPGHDKYKQIHIIGTDYTFRGAERTLISRIQGWLTKIAPSMEVQITSAISPSADVNQ